MSINLQTGGGYSVPVPAPAPQSLPGASSTDIQVAQKQPVQYPEISLPLPGDSPSPDVQPATPDQKRYDQVAAAAQRVVTDPYPVSDKSFTIYKDASGQYITRYTSLRDGRVTYVPEERALQQFESQQQTLKAAIKLQA